MDALISPLEISQNLNKYRIVDLRPYHDYSISHVKGAVHAPINPLLSDENYNLINIHHFISLMSALGINNSTEIIVYDNNQNKSSSLFWYMMKHYGHKKNIFVLDGGWGSASKLSLSKDPVAIPFTYYTPTVTKGYVYYLTDFINNFTNVKILDTRSKQEWNGETFYGNPRIGRIPGAIFIEFSKFLPSGPNHTFAAKETLQEEASKAGLLKNDKILIYCQHGARASLAGLALRSIGYENVIVYEGSMYEWSRHKALMLEI